MRKQSLGAQFIDVKKIEYPQFERLFWKQEKAAFKEAINKNITPHLVWTEIMTFIKGAPFSYQNEHCHLTKKQYLEYVGEHKTFVTREQKSLVWEILQRYEEWKTFENYFDMMDVANFLIKQILAV